MKNPAREEEEEEEKSQGNQVGIEGSESSRTAFSKWFMVLQESGSNGIQRDSKSFCSGDDASIGRTPMAPPKNALLLMRCRSTPAKRWLEEEGEEDEKEEVKVKKSLKWLMEEENRERYCKMTSHIAKQTLVASEKSRDLFTRSQSWKV